MYVNSSLVFLIDGYDRFTSRIFISRCLWKFLRHTPLFICIYEHSYVTYLHFLMVTNILRLSLFFLDGYKRFMSPTFISWQFWTFHVLKKSFLMIKNVSRQNPCFLDGYKRLFIKNPLIQRTAFFSPNHIIPLLFPCLLWTYKSDLVCRKKDLFPGIPYLGAPGADEVQTIKNMGDGQTVCPQIREK